MPYTVKYRPTRDRPSEPWVKVDQGGRIVSRHRSKAKARASIAAYYASKAHNRLATNARNNPLRMDPTRTLSIRRQFMAEISKAFRNLKKALRDFMVEKDALGLKEKKLPVPFQSLLGTHVQPREFEFRTSSQKLSAFNEWFRQQVEANILSPDPGTPAGTPWTTEFVESAYRRGQLNAYLSSREIVGTDQSSESFLRSSFAQPETMSKVELLGTRAFEQLKGITATMSSEMSRILAQGLADGRGAEDLARDLSERVDSLAGSRALTMARTEIINAHAEGQLDAFGRLGVEELGVMAEWSTAGDDRVCELCEPMEGKIFTVEEARGMIPLHPNCRCTWIPAVPE